MVNLMILTTPLTSRKKRLTSRSDSLILIYRNAFVMSAVSATFHLRNMMRISGKLGIRLGPASMQSFYETPLRQGADASKTGRTLVVVLDYFTIGR